MGEQVKWAARKRYAKGSVELAAIYGYDYKDGKLTVKPDEAAVVKEIFERYARGEGHHRIAQSLNERGIKRKYSAEPWSGSLIGKMLDNEKYIGDAITQKKYKEGSKVRVNKGELPQKYVENNHEAIVGREVFYAVQERARLLAEARKERKKYPLSPFSGKIKCAECGKGYRHRMNNRNLPYEKWIWSCSTYVQHGRKYCGGHNIREKDLKRLFLSAYNEASDFIPHETRGLGEVIKDLLAQERELLALKAKGYIKRADFDLQHAELVKQIKETEDAFVKQSRKSGNMPIRVSEYDDKLVAFLEVAKIDGYTIIFKFKNGATITRTFDNNADRKATWARKYGRV
jgi:hypothetical protein